MICIGNRKGLPLRYWLGIWGGWGKCIGRFVFLRPKIRLISRKSLIIIN